MIFRNFVKYLSVLLVLSVFVTSCSKKEVSTSEKFAVDPGPVIKDAMKKGKFLILIFESESCQYCTKLNKEVLNSMDVKEAQIKNGVEIAIINVNGDRMVIDPADGTEMPEKMLAYVYRITGYPTIIVFDKNNNYKKLYVIPGYIPKEDFIALLDYLGTGCYKKGIDIRKFKENGNKC